MATFKKHFLSTRGSLGSLAMTTGPNKDFDLPAYPGRLIQVFVLHLSEGDFSAVWHIIALFCCLYNSFLIILILVHHIRSYIKPLTGST